MTAFTTDGRAVAIAALVAARVLPKHAAELAHEGILGVVFSPKRRLRELGYSASVIKAAAAVLRRPGA